MQKKGLIVTILLILSIMAVGCQGNNVEDQREMTDLVLEWGRLVPVPTSALDFTVKAEGNMFSRSFRASFVAPQADIDSWLSASPGIRNVQPIQVDVDTKKYVIEPGGGANYAEVIVSSGRVTVYVSWS
jgi:hypothetical protein